MCPGIKGTDPNSVNDCPSEASRGFWDRFFNGPRYIEVAGSRYPVAMLSVPSWAGGPGGLAGEVEAAATDAYEIASAGGRNAGFLKNYAGKSVAELEKAVTSLDANVADHLGWIQDPTRHVADFFSRSIQEQEGLLSKWRTDAIRNASQRNILQGLMDRLP